MTVTRERFEQGMTYDAYKAQMTRNRDRLEENERSLELPAEEIAFFTQLPERVHALVITEDWCGDAMNNIPVLARLAEESGKLDLRFFLRDQNLDITDQYLKDGQHRSVPTFVFFDGDFRELGYWIERPAVISGLMGQAIGELYATDPAMQGVEPGMSPALMPEAARNRMMQFFGEFRARTRAQSDSEVVREIRELIAAGLPKA
jgi:hypothetical protein